MSSLINRFVLPVSSLLPLSLVPLALVGCGETVDVGGPQAADAGQDATSGICANFMLSGGGGGCDPDPTEGTCNQPTPGAWVVSAADYSTACNVADDCKAATFGDVCEHDAPSIAAIASSAFDAYSSKVASIQQSCQKAGCDPSECACPATPVACTVGVCELSTGVFERSCPNDALGVSFAFGPETSCARLDSRTDGVFIDLYSVPEAPVTLTFTPDGVNGKGAAQVCSAGTCVDATKVTLVLSQLVLTGNSPVAYVSYSLELANGKTSSAGFLHATLCATTGVCPFPIPNPG
jgi:hypothetical protein